MGLQSGPRSTSAWLITGNEDGAKHCATNILYSLQNLGCLIPPQADAGWLRQRVVHGMDLMHPARMVKDAGGIPASGNQRSEWDAGCHLSAANPEHR